MDRSRLPYLARIMHARPRLFVSILFGAAAVPVLPAAWPLATRALTGWDLGVGLYLVLTFWLMANETVAQIRRRAAVEDEGAVLILALCVAAALASLFAILLQLGVPAEEGRRPAQLIFATATIIVSWFFVHTIFAVHYAHGYYGDNAAKGSGLAFPGKENPDFWDFVYFSFVIGMTSQVSDVQITHRDIRRIATMHGILSFFFNVALLALTFNLAASAIQKS